MPDQTQIQAHIRWNCGCSQARCGSLLIDVIKRTVEFHAPGQIQIGAQLELLLWIALKGAIVRPNLRLEPRVTGGKPPIVQDLPLRRQLTTERLARTGVLHRLRENSNSQLRITVAWHKSQKIIIMIVEA